MNPAERYLAGPLDGDRPVARPLLNSATQTHGKHERCRPWSQSSSACQKTVQASHCATERDRRNSNGTTEYHDDRTTENEAQTLLGWCRSYVTEGSASRIDRSQWRPTHSTNSQGSPVANRIPSHGKLIGRSMAATLPVLSPTSILPPFRLTVLSLPQGKIRRAFKKTL